MKVKVEDLQAPPAKETTWYCQGPKGVCTVQAQTWFFARQRGAAKLGCLAEEVSAKLMEDPR